MADPPVPAVVNACTRDGEGGSPTAVVIDDATLTDDDRHAITRGTGTSHTAFIDTGTANTPTVRFFTSAGELTNCGHGIIAAQAVLLHRSGATEQHGRQRTGGRTFATTAVRHHDGVEVWFDQGVIALADHSDAAGGGIVAALGLKRADITADVRIASPGTPRLLVPVRDHPTLLSMRPDFERLAIECRRLGYLGCFTYALSPTTKTGTARMFAPAIGVDEDIANANSVGCLAAHLLDTSGNGEIEIHQGDTLRRPSSVFASATHTRSGIVARIGGVAGLGPLIDLGIKVTMVEPGPYGTDWAGESAVHTTPDSGLRADPRGTPKWRHRSRAARPLRHREGHPRPDRLTRTATAADSRRLSVSHRRTGLPGTAGDLAMLA